MKKRLCLLLATFTLPVLADNCAVNADLVVSFKGATTLSCKSNQHCTTKKASLPFKLYLQNDDLEQPFPSVSYLSIKDLPIATCYKDDFAKNYNPNLISLEEVLGKSSDARDKRKPTMRFTEEYGDEYIWLFQTISDITPPVLDSKGNLVVLRQEINDNKKQGELYSFNIRSTKIKFNYRLSVNLSYGFDSSFYVKDDPLFEKHKEFDDENVIVMGKYGDDKVLVKIDDENKTDKTYQTCLYHFKYNLNKGGYNLTKKDCVTYKDYVINQALHNKTYRLDKL